MQTTVRVLLARRTREASVMQERAAICYDWACAARDETHVLSLQNPYVAADFQELAAERYAMARTLARDVAELEWHLAVNGGDMLVHVVD